MKFSRIFVVAAFLAAPCAFAGDVSGFWKHAEKLGEYKDAEITLAEPDLMTIKVKVGFISRTVEWRRVETVPAN